MSRALHDIDHCLLGVMDRQQSIFYAASSQQMNELIQQEKDGVLIFNQHPQAIDFMDQLPRIDGQHCIEVFQETAGVFGLRAYCQLGTLQTPEKLELTR